MFKFGEKNWKFHRFVKPQSCQFDRILESTKIEFSELQYHLRCLDDFNFYQENLYRIQFFLVVKMYTLAQIKFLKNFDGVCYCNSLLQFLLKFDKIKFADLLSSSSFDYFKITYITLIFSKIWLFFSVKFQLYFCTHMFCR